MNTRLALTQNVKYTTAPSGHFGIRLLQTKKVAQFVLTSVQVSMVRPGPKAAPNTLFGCP